MATAIYALCAVTSSACAGLLLRAHLRAPSPLLLWSTVCFVLLAANNLLLVIDRRVFPDTDLAAVRNATALAGLLALLYGLITSTTRGKP